jgi:hypothetical protein
MAVVESSLLAEVSSSSRDESITAAVNSAEETPLSSELEASVESDGTVFEAITARTLAPVTLGVIVRVGGSAAPLSTMIRGWTVTRSLEQSIQTGEFTLRLTTPRGAYGPPWEHAGPPTCLQEIEFVGVYKTSTGLHYVPLLSRGISDSSGRELTLAGGPVEPFSVCDAGARYDRKKVSLNLPPGHGIDRMSIIAAAARRAGVTDIDLPVGRECTKEIAWTDAEWLVRSRELASIEGRALLWSPRGSLTAKRTGRPVGGEDVAYWQIREGDISSASGIRVDARGDVVTKVTVTGERQLYSDQCDVEIRRTKNPRKQIYAPKSPPFAQSSSGYVANPQEPAAPAPILVGITIRESEKRCGVVVWERITEYGYANPECARYEWDSGTSAFVRLTCYSESSSDDSAAAREYQAEYWGIVGVTERLHYYNSDGFRRQPEPGQSDAVIPLTGATSSATRDGDYLGMMERVSSIYCPRAAVKYRFSLSTEWLSVDPINGTKTLGNGDGIASVSMPWSVLGPGVFNPSAAYGERLVPFSETVESHVGDANGFLLSIERVKKGWLAVKGAPGYYLWGDGSESLEPSEQWMQTESEIESFVQTGKSSHAWSKQKFDSNGEQIASEEQKDNNSANPAIERINLAEVNPDAYVDAQEMGATVVHARRGNVEEFKVEVDASDLLECRNPNDPSFSSSLIEDEEEAEQVGKMIIDESAVQLVQFSLLVPNFYLNEGDVVHVYAHDIALDNDIRVKSVTWSGDERGRVTNNVVGKLYGF